MNSCGCKIQLQKQIDDLKMAGKFFVACGLRGSVEMKTGFTAFFGDSRLILRTACGILSQIYEDRRHRRRSADHHIQDCTGLFGEKFGEKLGKSWEKLLVHIIRLGP